MAIHLPLKSNIFKLEQSVHVNVFYIDCIGPLLVKTRLPEDLAKLNYSACQRVYTPTRTLNQGSGYRPTETVPEILAAVHDIWCRKMGYA